MDDASTQESLELDVTNFGPIIKATVDLRPLTVFVGPSNTGKSYLAILIYALHQRFSHFSDRKGQPDPMFFSRGAWMRWSGLQWELTRETTLSALTNMAEQILGTDKRQALDEEGIVLSGPVADVIRSVLEATGDGLGDEISRCFGIGTPDALIRKGSREGAHIVLRRSGSNAKPSIEHGLTIGVQTTAFRATIPDGTRMRVAGGDAGFWRAWAEQVLSMADRTEKPSDFGAWPPLGSFVSHVWSDILAPLYYLPFYLPADRTGVMHAHHMVVSALIRGAATSGLHPTPPSPLLSGILADFLDQLLRLSSPEWRQSPYDFGTPLEAALLDGSVRAKSSEVTHYPRFIYRPKGWKDDLPLMNASSMVSELAPVVLYLRHVIEPRDVLIVEEPESHLHPAMQVKFIRQLAALVQAGVRVLITTHSEWVLEELANIVQRSKLPENRRKGDADSTVSLRPDQVGAWLFKQKRRPKGSVVEEIKMDEETGLYPTDYDAVSEELYNESVNIFNRIQDIKAE